MNAIHQDTPQGQGTRKRNDTYCICYDISEPIVAVPATVGVWRSYEVLRSHIKYRPIDTRTIWAVGMAGYCAVGIHEA